MKHFKLKSWVKVALYILLILTFMLLLNKISRDDEKAMQDCMQNYSARSCERWIYGN